MHKNLLKILNRNKIVVDNIFSFKASLDIIRSNNDETVRTNDATCNIACPQAETGSFVFISKGRAII